jgi:hypothetical protein
MKEPLFVADAAATGGIKQQGLSNVATVTAVDGSILDASMQSTSLTSCPRRGNVEDATGQMTQFASYATRSGLTIGQS